MKETLLEKELKRFNNILGYKYYLNEAEGDSPVETAPDTTMDDVVDLDAPKKEEKPTDNTQGINVTDIVNKVDDVEEKVDDSDDSLTKIMDTISKLENKLGDMEQILAKINDLEGKIEETMPKTPEQKLELRSLDSYPYNVKLDDFWRKDIPGYEIEGSNKDTFKKKELVLTKDEVDDYSDQQVRDSFSVSNDEDEDYNTNDNDRGYKFEKKVAFKTGPSRMTGGYW
jgi:hypothetical protein